MQHRAPRFVEVGLSFRALAIKRSDGYLWYSREAIPGSRESRRFTTERRGCRWEKTLEDQPFLFDLCEPDDLWPLLLWLEPLPFAKASAVVNARSPAARKTDSRIFIQAVVRAFVEQVQILLAEQGSILGHRGSRETGHEVVLEGSIIASRCD